MVTAEINEEVETRFLVSTQIGVSLPPQTLFPSPSFAPRRAFLQLLLKGFREIWETLESVCLFLSLIMFFFLLLVK